MFDSIQGYSFYYYPQCLSLNCLLIRHFNLSHFRFFVAYSSFLQTLEAHKQPLAFGHKNVVLSALPPGGKLSPVDTVFGLDGKKTEATLLLAAL